MTCEPEPISTDPAIEATPASPIPIGGETGRAFSTRLVNPPNRDPALLVCLHNSAHDYLFDCGSVHRLSNHEKLRIKRVFISHAHIDHTIGLDQLLRSLIYRPESLEIYGPQGILEQVYHRLQSYAWNLTGDSPFQVQVHQLGAGLVHSQLFACCSQFQPTAPPAGSEIQGLTLPEGPFLSWTEVDHGVPCLAYVLQWPDQLTFQAELARADGLASGPWIRDLKLKFSRGDAEANLAHGTVGSLAQRYLSSRAGEKLAYVTDTLLGEAQQQRLRPFVADSSELWCEANYLERDIELARQNLHGTVSQAARLALAAEVQSLHLFHLSRRYSGSHEEHLQEARRIFPSSYLGHA